MESIVFRKLGPEDAEPLLAYLKRIGSESDNLSFGPEGLPMTIAAEADYLRQMGENPRALNLGAWRNGQLVGNGSLSPLPRRMRHRAELSISVRKDFWNQGIGRGLMERLIRHAREQEIELLSLEVRTDNLLALHLYQSFGFAQIGIFPAFFRIHGRYADCALMVLDLRNGR